MSSKPSVRNSCWIIVLVEVAWFDRDKLVNAKKRYVKSNIEKVIESLRAAMKQCQEVNDKCLEKFSSGTNPFSNELAVLGSRTKALELVLADCPEASQALQEFIRSFSCSLGDGSKNRLAPPCKSYGSLFLAKDLWKLVESCETAESKQELEAVSKDLLEQKKPLLDVAATAKATANDLQKAMAELEKQKANAQIPAQKASGVSSAKASSQSGGLTNAKTAT